MKKTKNIISLASIIILVSVVSYFFFILRNNIDDDVLNKATTLPNIAEESNLLDGKDETEMNKDSKENPAISLNISYKDTDSATLLNMYSLCGHASESSKEYIKLNNSSKLSDAQIQAKDRIINQCENWYEFIDSLSTEQLELQLQIYDDQGDLNIHFNPFTNKNSNNDQILKDSRDLMKHKGGSFTVTIGALANLLYQDYDFIGAIAHRLGTKNYNFISDNSYNISILYACDIFPQKCSRNSLQMLSLCVNREINCGLSYHDYYAASITPNQYSDTLNTIDIIKYLIRKGFFD
ncbi:MAG: hypothetical protein L3J53_07905 [Proteobacteria bacterium]|nr:hypothetical protein [Pseudomonadota bacterium]